MIHFPIKKAFAKFLEGYTLEQLADLEILGLDHDDRKTFGTKYTFGGYADRWHECPFDSEREAMEFAQALQRGFEIIGLPNRFSEGKARELEGARSCAVWPDATDEELSQPKEQLEAVLMARLPAMMAEFKQAMESLGFTY